MLTQSAPLLYFVQFNVRTIWHQSATNLEVRAGLVEENDDEPAGQPATAGTVSSWEAPNEP
jgi:hypothetical protein